MQRRSIFRHAGLVGVLAAGTAPAVQAQPALRWRMASSFPKSLDVMYGNAEVFSKAVRAMSGGKFEISVHAAGELTPALSVADAVQEGSVEAAHTAPYYFFGKDECFALGCAIPFGLNTRQMTAWMMEGNGGRLMRDFYAGYNIVNLAAGNTCGQMGGWFRKELGSAKALKGVKIRIGGFGGKILARLGAVPQNIPAGEIYTALEKGTIDAAEWLGPYDDLKLGFAKVAPYYYYPGWQEGSAQVDFFINAKAYEALSAEHKAILEAASAQAHLTMQAQYDARNPGALRQLVGAGVKLRPFPRDLMSTAFQEAMALYSELSASNPTWKKIYADFAKFRAEQNMWYRFTEGTFDRFMQSQKF
ncbi:TRAP transporter substrate-binding protein [Hydrogenophaga sp. BPS33]|uniref:TRAP transporter substrate-binding protein n=1 Tax=Hydrogenophaga sp. BPS33 TaxID=2651974 RepID=UPI00131FF48E|nr:ABC transporter substrate-binding protein [Hydrogenophaga sp. BPS33]QHE84713.1 ABC transporter substrate-binding protein [Hydrogenophaga sp. BPS33]